MEAKDTVMGMNSGLVQGLYLKSQQIKEVLEAQAEISFKAGYDQRSSEIQGAKEVIGAAKKKSYQAGIREVVEWGKEICPHSLSSNLFRPIKKGLCEMCREAQLKEWNLEDE